MHQDEAFLAAGNTAAHGSAARRADAALVVASAVCFCVLPAATSFGAAAVHGSGTAAAAVRAWRPQPSNDAYDGMLIVVAASVPATDAALRCWRRRRCHQHQQQQQQQLQVEDEGGAELLEQRQQQLEQRQQQQERPSAGALMIDDKKALGPPRPAGVFELFAPGLALALGIGYAAAGTPATAALWLAAALALAGLLWRASSRPRSAAAASGGGGRSSQALAWEEGLSLQPWRRRGRASLAFSVVLALVAAGFIGGPVLAPWSAPVEPFVRWHPFSVDAERVWRGVFAAYACAMLLAALLDPLARPHRPFAAFLALSGAVHSLVMLAMWAAASTAGGPNGNMEHLYGDVLAWATVAVVAGGFLRLGGSHC